MNSVCPYFINYIHGRRFFMEILSTVLGYAAASCLGYACYHFCKAVKEIKDQKKNK